MAALLKPLLNNYLVYSRILEKFGEVVEMLVN